MKDVPLKIFFVTWLYNTTVNFLIAVEVYPIDLETQRKRKMSNIVRYVRHVTWSRRVFHLPSVIHYIAERTLKKFVLSIKYFAAESKS